MHRFRKKSGEVVAEVLSVDRKTGKVAGRVGGTMYLSLSVAGQAIAHPTNGWVLAQEARRKACHKVETVLQGGLE